MSQKTKNLIKEIFQDNFLYLLDLYDKYMCEVGERNTRLEKLIRSQVRGESFTGMIVRSEHELREDGR